jgi:hypothetical protein
MNHGGIKQRISLSSLLFIPKWNAEYFIDRGSDPFVDRESIVGTRVADPQRRGWDYVERRHGCLPNARQKAKKSEQA